MPTAGEVFAKQHVETIHVEKNGTQCFKSGSNDNWENKSAQDESNVIFNTDEADQSKKQDAEVLIPINIRTAGESNTLQVELRSERMILMPELTVRNCQQTRELTKLRVDVAGK